MCEATCGIASTTLPHFSNSKKKAHDFYNDKELKHLCKASKSSWFDCENAGRPLSGYLYEKRNSDKVRCRDDTVPKTVDTRKHCKVGLRACNNLPQPPPYIFVFRGCGRLLRALNPTLQCFLVSTVFGTVSSLHLTSFLMIFTLGTALHL